MREKGLVFVLFFSLLSNIAWIKPSKGNEYKKITSTPSNEVSFASYVINFYNNLNNKELNFEAFKLGLKGHLILKNSSQLKNTKYLTIIDFSKHSKEERLFIINTETQQIIHKSLVAHGRNSGLEFAKYFSNKPNSHKSSIGFYKTAETYIGKHGYSLRLDGLEYTNNNVRKRAIVIHAADYAEKDFVQRNGRLGRSYGCPSLPKKGYKEVIVKIKEGSCLFIYYPQKTYLDNSKLTNAIIDVNKDI